MQRLLPFLVLADIALIVVAMFDCVTTDYGTGRALPKGVWLVLILLLSPIGPIMWFLTKHADEHAAFEEFAEDESRAVRPLPPDDDPEFLRELGRRAKEAAKLNQAEARRRAQEQRRDGEADRPDRDDRLSEGQPED